MWLAVRERVVEKSPVREYRPPGSVRGAPGNRRPYRDCKSLPHFSSLRLSAFLCVLCVKNLSASMFLPSAFISEGLAV